MFGLFDKYLDQLVESVFGPLWTRVLALSWGRRVVLLGLLIAIAATTAYWPTIAGVARRAQYELRAGAVGTVLPLESAEQRHVEEATERLATSLAPELARAGREGYEPWPIAQITVALGGMRVVDPDLSTFLESHADSSCNCWRTMPDTRSPQDVAVSGWIAYALARLNQSLNGGQLEFFARNQQTEGWWPVFSRPKDDDAASTYATAWTLLALNEHLKHGLLRPADAAAVRAAIENGRGWLFNHRIPGAARWKDYPLALGGAASESLSGLVMHVLHEVGGAAELHTLDEIWLASLPPTLPTVSAYEMSNIWFNTEDGRFQDVHQQYRLPWLLAATVDAYPSGTRAERGRALLWIDRVLRDTDILSADAVQENWVRAEALMSLRHLYARRE